MKINKNFKAYLMPRSGTTLFTNLVKGLFKLKNGVGNHDVSPGWENPVGVIRDFRDVMASNWRIYHAKYDSDGRVTNKIEGEILKNMLVQTKLRIKELEKFKRMYPNHLIIRYENFWNNNMYIFRTLSKWLDIKIDEEEMAWAISEHTMVKSKNIADSLGDDFDNIDKETNLHAKHIYTGKPGTWKEFVKEEDQKRVNDYLGAFLIKHGYEI